MTVDDRQDAQTRPDAAPIAVNARAAGVMFGLSVRTWRRLDSSGQVPTAVVIGGSKRWVVAELEAWSRCGCPPRHQWIEKRRTGFVDR